MRQRDITSMILPIGGTAACWEVSHAAYACDVLLYFMKRRENVKLRMPRLFPEDSCYYVCEMTRSGDCCLLPSSNWEPSSLRSHLSQNKTNPRLRQKLLFWLILSIRSHPEVPVVDGSKCWVVWTRRG